MRVMRQPLDSDSSVNPAPASVKPASRLSSRLHVWLDECVADREMSALVPLMVLPLLVTNRCALLAPHWPTAPCLHPMTDGKALLDLSTRLEHPEALFLSCKLDKVP